MYVYIQFFIFAESGVSWLNGRERASARCSRRCVCLAPHTCMWNFIYIRMCSWLETQQTIYLMIMQPITEGVCVVECVCLDVSRLVQVQSCSGV